MKAGITREEASKLLEEATESGMHVYFFDNDTVSLDGHFTVKQLKAVIRIMKFYSNPSKLTL